MSLYRDTPTSDGENAQPRDEVHCQSPEWLIREGVTCVHVQALSASAALEAGANRLRTSGGWTLGPDIDHEVFPPRGRRKHARLGDCTRTVIAASRPRGGTSPVATATAACRDEP